MEKLTSFDSCAKLDAPGLCDDCFCVRMIDRRLRKAFPEKKLMLQKTVVFDPERDTVRCRFLVVVPDLNLMATGHTLESAADEVIRQAQLYGL